uniref:Uncharacterized protein n=1 Tax=Heterorhabditis bacteriophora TaxID=37862 RepID=A0A1I7WEG7_HETBA
MFVTAKIVQKRIPIYKVTNQDLLFRLLSSPLHPNSRRMVPQFATSGHPLSIVLSAIPLHYLTPTGTAAIHIAGKRFENA